MSSDTALKYDSRGWTETEWDAFNTSTRARILSARNDEQAWKALVGSARVVLRKYSTSFFLVTRFLPAAKRAQVEAIYAAVRYPDEIVDTFPLSAADRDQRMTSWRGAYDEAVTCPWFVKNVARGIPCFVAGFAKVVQDAKIPVQHYHAFLDAMSLDARPRPFATVNDLIDSYVYGSAVVVGFFLTHVYGSTRPQDFHRAIESARALGIALQLTNFLRDVAEDQTRGRVYLPTDYLRSEGIESLDTQDASQHKAISRVLARLSAYAEENYRIASENLDAFSEDSRTAIRACIDVYRQLNERMGDDNGGILHRESVPIAQKLRVLPRSKYWRLPLAYLTR
jgi:phytoene synthase